MKIPVGLRRFLRANLLTILTALSVFGSVLVGLLIRSLHPDFEGTFTPRTVSLVKFVGDLFLQMLRSLILPLIVTSLICAIGNLNAKMNKFIGGYGVLYYMVTTLLAIILGIIIVMLLRPGDRYQREKPADTEDDAFRTTPVEKILDLVRNMFPENPVQAALEQYKTELKPPADPALVGNPEYYQPTIVFERTMNILGIVIMSVFVGIAISQINSKPTKRPSVKSTKSIQPLGNGGPNMVLASNLSAVDKDSIELNCVTLKGDETPASDEQIFKNPEQSSIETLPMEDLNALEDEDPKDKSVFLKFMNEANAVFMMLVGWVIWLSPIGIFFLILGKLLETGDLLGLLDSLSFYALAVVGGIFIHGLIVLPLIYFALVRENPFKVIRGMTQALVTAFGTSSSSATLPVTMRCLNEMGDSDPTLKIDPRVVNFIVPIGATINMDGTALYEAVAAIFISQLNNIEMTPLTILTVCLTATLGSVGAAGIPQAGLITLIIVLDTLGLPISDITVIITIDWLLDRFRTVVNVLGDSFGCVIVSKRAKFDDVEDLPVAPES